MKLARFQIDHRIYWLPLILSFLYLKQHILLSCSAMGSWRLIGSKCFRLCILRKRFRREKEQQSESLEPSHCLQYSCGGKQIDRYTKISSCSFATKLRRRMEQASIGYCAYKTTLFALKLCIWVSCLSHSPTVIVI